MGKVVSNVVNAVTLGLSSGKLDPVGAVKSAVTGLSLGTVDLTTKTPKASASVAETLAEEKKSNTKKRKALYSTKGGVLGQEVQRVEDARRGNIFGN